VLPLGATPPLTSHRLRRHIKGDVATRSTGATTARRPRTTRNGPDQNMILSTTAASARSTLGPHWTEGLVVARWSQDCWHHVQLGTTCQTVDLR